MFALSEGLKAERAILIAPASDPIVAAKRLARSMSLSGSLAAQLFDEYDERHQTRASEMHARTAAPGIGRPVLIVHDMDDHVVPWSDGACCARHWRGARLLTTTHLGHDRILNDASVIKSSLRFLKGEHIGQPVILSRTLPDEFA